MDNIVERDEIIYSTPVAEGVRFEFGTATACAVRNRSRDITVRVYQESRSARKVIQHIPLVRGVARLFGVFHRLFSGLEDSAGLKPRHAVRGSAFSQEFARLFSTRPQTLAAIVSGLAIPLILLAMVIGLPKLIELLLVSLPHLPRVAVNIVCCLFRILGALLSVYMVCHLKVINRMCMYRGAASKVINAYEAYGSGMTHESVVLSPRLTERSDGAFLIIVMILSIVAFACVNPAGLLLQLAVRIALILAIAAISNEIILPLERANPNGTLASVRKPLMELQHLFTIEPHNQMIEVALCAFRAARENDLTEAG